MDSFLDPHSYILNSLSLTLLLCCSAVVSGTEVAFFSLTQKQIVQFKHALDPKKQKGARLLRYPRRLLATILILNNLITVSFITLSTRLLWYTFGADGIPSLAVLSYTLISTTCIVLFGELIPKIYANRNNMRIAQNMARPVALAVSALYPLASLLLHMGNLFSKRILREKYTLSIDKLSRALEITTIQETPEKEMLRGIITFSQLAVSQVMQPRMAIKAVDISIDFHRLIDLMSKVHHTRLPVYRGTIDRIEGVLHTKHLLPHLDEDASFAWQQLLKRGLFVSEDRKIDALLLEFQEKRIQMAIVVDEYGNTSGLITLEDIAGGIIGDITDTFEQD